MRERQRSVEGINFTYRRGYDCGMLSHPAANLRNQFWYIELRIIAEYIVCTFPTFHRCWLTGHPVCRQLRVATCSDNYGIGILATQAAQSLTALMVSCIGYGACVQYTDICLLAIIGSGKAARQERLTQSTGFSKVQLTPQGDEPNLHAPISKR